MIISEKKNLERKFFKNLRNKSTAIDMRNVEINVKTYVDSIFSKDLKKKHIGIYWPLENEVDLRSHADEY
jgi:5-formyltetrahydrofolate cyclo-ligase